MGARQQIRRPEWAAGEILCFGSFHLIPAERRLECAGEAVRLGDRALDILLLLVANAPAVVSKAALLEHVWPDGEVDEGNLRFQIAILRRALNGGLSGGRYLATVQGRGYCFVASISRIGQGAGVGDGRPSPESTNPVSEPPAHIMGRDGECAAITQLLQQQRFVSVVGPGGIGKTTVAVAVFRALRDGFNGNIRFLDLASLSDASHLPETLAAVFGVSGHTTDPIASLITLLKDERMLLVFDSCEHIVEAAARITEALIQKAPHIHILATSREPLRADGEYVYRISPLEAPAPQQLMTAARLLDFSATKLFVERITTIFGELEISDQESDVIAELCRRLDGLPLAIELAVGRAHAAGLGGISNLLDTPLAPAPLGKRIAPERHQTITATLDWSYGLLTSAEAGLFRRLSVFAGRFSMDAAVAVAHGQDAGEGIVAEILACLVSKSLVSAALKKKAAGFRLLDTTRAYALQKLREGPEYSQAMLGLTHYLTTALRNADAGAEKDPNGTDLEWSTDNLGNVRLALEWCFSTENSATTGVQLAVEAVGMFRELSLWGECRYWMVRALDHLGTDLVGSRCEMRLQESLGLSSKFTEGVTDAARNALNRSLEIATTLGDRLFQLRVIGGLISYYHRSGWANAALEAAQRSAVIAGSLAAPDAAGIADRLMGTCLHIAGNQRQALQYFVAVDRPFGGDRGAYIAGCAAHDYRIKALCSHARSLWISGYCNEAVDHAEQTVSALMKWKHPIGRCIALAWVAPVFLWQAEWERADEVIARLIDEANRNSLTAYIVAGRGFRCELMVRRRAGTDWLALQRNHLETRPEGFKISSVSQLFVLAEGLLLSGEIEQGREHADGALTTVESHGGAYYYLPEILRVRALSRTVGAGCDLEAAKAMCLQGLELARENGALSWELRLALTLVRIPANREDVHEAWGTLSQIESRFGLEQDSADIRRARLELAAGGYLNRRPEKALGGRRGE